MMRRQPLVPLLWLPLMIVPPLLLLLWLPAAAAPQPPAPPPPAAPDQPVELTVFGLRPLNLTGLVNKNTGDAAGDLFFFLTDRFVAPFACNVTNGRWWACHEQGTLSHDSVYTKSVLEVEGSWPNATAAGSCRPDPGHRCYSGCNPSDANGSAFRCGCAIGPAPVPPPPPSPSHHHHGSGGVPCDVVGRAEIRSRYETCADGCTAPNDQWKSDLSKLIGGEWYSTTAQGDCSNPQRERCAWRVKSIVKTVNASCVNGNFLRSVAAKASRCLAGCTAAEREDATSSCYVTCIFQRLLGKSTSFPNATHAGMSAAEMVAPWLAGFESEDPAKGGCPALKHDDVDAGGVGAVQLRPCGEANATGRQNWTMQTDANGLIGLAGADLWLALWPAATGSTPRVVLTRNRTTALNFEFLPAGHGQRGAELWIRTTKPVSGPGELLCLDDYSSAPHHPPSLPPGGIFLGGCDDMSGAVRTSTLLLSV